MIVSTSLSVLMLVSIQMHTDLMRLVTALAKLPPARQLTTRWMRGLLLQDVLGGTSALVLLGSLWRSAWRSGATASRRLSEHSMERYTYTYVCICICSTLATHGLRVFSLVWRCIGHIVRPKLKQDGGICLPRQFRTSVSLETDVDRTEKRKLSLQWSITG